MVAAAVVVVAVVVVDAVALVVGCILLLVAVVQQWPNCWWCCPIWNILPLVVPRSILQWNGCNSTRPFHPVRFRTVLPPKESGMVEAYRFVVVVVVVLLAVVAVVAVVAVLVQPQPSACLARFVLVVRCQTIRVAQLA